MTTSPDPLAALSPEQQQLVELLAEQSCREAGGEGLATASQADQARWRQAARKALGAMATAGFTVSRAAAAPTTAAEEVAAARGEAERLLRSGEPLLAFNLVQEARESWPDDLRLRQLEGLALSRSGAMKRANERLQQLRDEGHTDGETLGLLARTHKDLALSAGAGEGRDAHLAAAFAFYEDGYQRSAREGRVGDAYYTGINAATLALLRGDRVRAGEIARHVQELCRGELSRGAGGEYWLRATLGEAALVLGDVEGARGEYRQAAVAAGRRFADLASTRRQARLLLAHLGLDQGWLESTLAVPPVLVFTGHMVDHPDRPTPRFPAGLEGAVRDEVRSRLDRMRPVAAYGSAACGADILCLEAVLEQGGEVHVVLPFPPEEFRKVSVDFAGGEWGTRFERVLEAAASIQVASDHRAEGSVSTFEYANLILTGMGLLRGRLLETPVVGLAVWDGGPAGGIGGTAGVVELWRRRGLPVEVVDLAALLRSSDLGKKQRGAAPADEAAASDFAHEIRAMLFADAVGYSKLTEDQVRLFIQHFLGSIAALNERVGERPIHMEVAGDGLYFVFPDTAAAGHYGLELSDLVRTTDWQGYGLPPTMNMRVALHCGPVFACTDPITKGPMFTGPHTSRTARIEPITPPGQVYASSAFAAVAAANGVDDLDFTYIGRTKLAKKYGSLSLYHVQRA